jgi:ABC-type polysaccharide/polyol phosphate transport system ATPase subunit
LPTSSDGTIRTTHLWKRFRADRSAGRLSDHLARLGGRRGGFDEGAERWRWALRDVNLAIDPGESVGLIGFNGSGKSTLLKILTRVMYPHAGTVEVSGRVGALLEVVSGIHHELTGRENLYLYGSLMGLPRSTVSERFDEMVEFAELESAIDRQVKFYSLGMQMRLGFAVASFLDSDILLVDEVLAVGDASFQQKCLDQMRSMLQAGTTLVLVSHDLTAIEATCDRVVWLRRGVVTMDGPTRAVLTAYRQSIEEAAEVLSAVGDGRVRLLKVDVRCPDRSSPHTQEALDVSVVVDAVEERGVTIAVGVSEGPATPIWVVRRDVRLVPGQTTVTCSIDHLPLARGRYAAWVCVVDSVGADLVPWQPAASFDVFGPELDPAPLAVVRLAPVHVAPRWRIEQPA